MKSVFASAALRPMHRITDNNVGSSLTPDEQTPLSSDPPVGQITHVM